MILNKEFVEDFARNQFNRQDIQVKPCHREFQMSVLDAIPNSWTDENYIDALLVEGEAVGNLNYAFGCYCKVIQYEPGDTLVCDLRACDASVINYVVSRGVNPASVNMLSVFSNVVLPPTYSTAILQLIIPYGAKKISGTITNTNRTVSTIGLYYVVKTLATLHPFRYTPSYYFGTFCLPDRVFLSTALLGFQTVPDNNFEQPYFPTIYQTPTMIANYITTSGLHNRFFNAYFHGLVGPDLSTTYGFSFTGWEIIPQISGSFPAPDSFPLLAST